MGDRVRPSLALSSPRNLTAEEDYLRREELGNVNWRLLHFLGSRYHPTRLSRSLREGYRRKTEAFVRAFFGQYPCGMCRDHAVERSGKMWRASAFDSREALQEFLCEFHNDVSKSLKRTKVYVCRACPDPAVRRYEEESLRVRNLTYCTLSHAEAGNVGWQCLHSFAEAYPDVPTASDKKMMREFVEGFVELFPVDPHDEFWAPAGRSSVALTDGPIRVPDGDLEMERTYAGRAALSKWVWTWHNAYNRAYGKPELPFLCRADASLVAVSARIAEEASIRAICGSTVGLIPDADSSLLASPSDVMGSAREHRRNIMCRESFHEK